MADPFSIISGAAGIISLGFAIAQGLVQIADAIGSAGEEVRVYAEEVRNFSRVLSHVRTELISSTDISLPLQSLIKDVTDICDRALEPLKCLMVTLNTLLIRFKSSPKKIQQLGLRLSWVFRTKNKLLFYRKVLKVQHRLLDTILGTITLQRARNSSPSITYILQLSLESSIAADEQSHRATRKLDSVLGFEEAASDARAIMRAMQSSHEIIGEPIEEEPNPESINRVSEDQVAMLKISPSPSFNDTDEELSEEELRIIDEQIECDLSSESQESAQDLWHDIGALQRKMLRLASDTLSSSRETSIEEGMISALHQSSELEYKMAVFLVCPPKSTVGLIAGSEIIYLNGTDASLSATGTNFQNESETQERLLTNRISVAGNERATWVTMLNELQRMERDSMTWERDESSAFSSFSSRHGCETPVWDDHTMAIALQRKSHTLATISSDLKKNYAMTTFSHLIEMVAMLGLHWKLFDRMQDIYRAEGNGCMLTGKALADVGLVFTFQIFGNRTFRGNRIIPAEGVRELCFGLVSTIFRNPDRARTSEILDSDLRNLNILRLGSRQEIAETLGLIGCSTITCNFFLDETKKVEHLFPVVFEIMGMLGETLHIKGSSFRRLPNPTYYKWNKKFFSPWTMLKVYYKLREPAGPKFPYNSLKELESIMSLVNAHDVALPVLDALHSALDACNSFLHGMSQGKIMDILQIHLDLVLNGINGMVTDIENERFSGTGDGSNIFHGLNSVSRQDREWEFLNLYLSPKSPIDYKAVMDQDADTQAIWDVLIFRMLCWLLLHDFHEKDTQISQNELFGSQLPVYIV